MLYNRDILNTFASLYTQAERRTGMKGKYRKILRTALFILGGAASGYVYYYFFGCDGSCAITSSPWRSMLYVAVIGALVAAITEKENKDCNT